MPRPRKVKTTETNDSASEKPPPKKRGRKSKKELEELKQKALKEGGTENTIVSAKPPPKKRGRKPKGGKMISKDEIENIVKDKVMQNILHLKCSTSDG